MPINSQNLKQSSFMSSLPDYWSEDDKINYELLVADAKRYFPYMNDYIVHIGVVAEINKQLGRGENANEDDVKKLMKKYENNSLEYITPYDPDFDFKATIENLLVEDAGPSSVVLAGQKKYIDNIEEDDEINEAN